MYLMTREHQGHMTKSNSKEQAQCNSLKHVLLYTKFRQLATNFVHLDRYLSMAALAIDSAAERLLTLKVNFMHWADQTNASVSLDWSSKLGRHSSAHATRRLSPSSSVRG